MHLLVIVLNKTEVLSKLLAAFMEAGIGGATVAETKGMLNVVGRMEEDLPPVFQTLRRFLDLDNESNRTIFMLVTDEQVKLASEITNRVTGGLNKPNTGILFTVPVGYAEGLR